LLNVTQDFPEPKDIFSGAIFTAMYMVKIHQGMLAHHGFPPDWSNRIDGDYRKIINEKRHVLEHIMEGIYRMNNPRW